MGLAEIFLIGVGLSMDAFAVSVCKGLGMKRVNYGHALVIALFFGGFQALMPTIGWLLGAQLQVFIAPIDHWIAFGLLALIGGKMLWDTFYGGEDDAEESSPKLDIKELFMLAIATSIDALATGIMFALVQVDIVSTVTLIGCTTFVISFAGVVVGNKFGAKYETASSIVGGVVLILIGLKVLLEHLGVLV